jgi:hypothetical protein
MSVGRPHALVVGGTGMLRGVCMALAERGWTVSVVARGHAGLGMLASAAAGTSGAINPLPVDYHDLNMLAARLRSARAAHGAFSLAVCWIHQSGAAALELIAEMAAGGRRGCTLIEVLGSDARCPGAVPKARLTLEGIVHRRVVLGFVCESGRSRWLTHAEIAQGVLGAIECDAQETIVGTIEPWEARPG